MKANELMIGDWVRFDMSISYKNPQGNGMWVNCQVESISRPMFKGRTRNLFLKGDNFYGGYERTLGEIEPIPLTPEILEKNGFKHIERIPTMDSEIGTWRSNKLGGATIKKYLIGIEITVFCLIAGHSKIGDIYHLHQLQHALRLCGIKKEITL